MESVETSKDDVLILFIATIIVATAWRLVPSGNSAFFIMVVIWLVQLGRTIHSAILAYQDVKVQNRIDDETD